MKDWRTRLEEWKSGVKPTKKAHSLAFPWESCAISEVDARIPRGYAGIPGKPFDPILQSLGHQFTGAVYSKRDYDAALEILNQINHREIELLMQMGLTEPEVSDDVSADRVKEKVK